MTRRDPPFRVSASAPRVSSTRRRDITRRRGATTADARRRRREKTRRATKRIRDRIARRRSRDRDLRRIDGSIDGDRAINRLHRFASKIGSCAMMTARGASTRANGARTTRGHAGRRPRAEGRRGRTRTPEKAGHDESRLDKGGVETREISIRADISLFFDFHARWAFSRVVCVRLMYTLLFRFLTCACG